MRNTKRGFENNSDSSTMYRKERQLPTIRGIIGEAIPFNMLPMGKSKIQKMISPKYTHSSAQTPILYNSQQKGKAVYMKSPQRAKFEAFQKFITSEFNHFRLRIRKQDSLIGLTSTSVRISGHKVDKSSKSQKDSKIQKTETSSEQNGHSNPENPQIQIKYDNHPKSYATKTNLIQYTNARQKISKKFRYNQVKLVPKFKYLLGPGNNSQLIREILQNRGNWMQTNEYDTLFNLRWEQQSEQAVYIKTKYSKYKQMISHLENHEEISSKGGLIRTLNRYCKRNGLDCFNIIPISFVFNWQEHDKLEQQMKRFIYYYSMNHPTQKQTLNKNKEYIDIMKLIARNSKVLNFGFQKTKINQYPLLSGSYKSDPQESSPYLWIIKPSDCNRGIGIKIFSSLDQLVKIIKKWEETKLFRNQFIIQKYIQRPKLIKNRKFDIRVWMLIDSHGQGYFFQEGYIRTSSQDFQTNPTDLQNSFIHLTNNAIQKNNPNYGIFEEGNQLSFDDFNKFFQEGDNFRQKFVPQMKNICQLIVQSSRKTLIFSPNTFQIFGLDFMIDFEDNLWLIQVNTNPCIQLSSALLASIIPRMLDDAFKIVLDPIFKPSTNQAETKKYPVQGYQDQKNLWVKLEPVCKQFFLPKPQCQKSDEIIQVDSQL